MAKVFWINNLGGGFADHVEVAEGTTVEKFIAAKMGAVEPADFLIRVNRLPASRDQVLQDGDRVTCTPVKLEGALLRQ